MSDSALLAERQVLLAQIARLKAEAAEEEREAERSAARPTRQRGAKGPSVGRIPWLPHIDAETRARFMPRDHRPLSAAEEENAGLQNMVMTLHGDIGEALQKERKKDHRG